MDKKNSVGQKRELENWIQLVMSFLVVVFNNGVYVKKDYYWTVCRLWMDAIRWIVWLWGYTIQDIFFMWKENCRLLLFHFRVGKLFDLLIKWPIWVLLDLLFVVGMTMFLMCLMGLIWCESMLVGLMVIRDLCLKV